MNRDNIEFETVKHIGVSTIESLFDFYEQDNKFAEKIETLVIPPYVQQQLRSKQYIASKLHTNQHDDGLFVIVNGLGTDFVVDNDGNITFWFSDTVDPILSETYKHPDTDELEQTIDDGREANHIYPTDELKRTFRQEFGDEATEDFFNALSKSENKYPDVNGTYILVMVAARHELFGHDVTQWAEKVGFVTSGTFSNKKNKLIDADFVDTHKVLFDIGRPRHQLTTPRGVEFTSTTDMLNKYKTGYEPKPRY